jgi:hypothetical protein
MKIQHQKKEKVRIRYQDIQVLLKKNGIISNAEENTGGRNISHQNTEHTGSKTYLDLDNGITVFDPVRFYSLITFIERRENSG